MKLPNPLLKFLILFDMFFVSLLLLVIFTEKAIPVYILFIFFILGYFSNKIVLVLGKKNEQSKK